MKNNMKNINLILALLLVTSCVASNTDDKFRYGAVPARSFAKSVQNGQNKDFSVYLALNDNQEVNTINQQIQNPQDLFNPIIPLQNVDKQYAGLTHDPYADPLADSRRAKNPSLWTDDSDTFGMFRDLRAYQPMDVVTVLIRENNFGKKKADTKTDSKFSISAGIAALFGLEKKVESVMPSDFNANSMVDATTNSKLDAKGETKREGSLTGTISAVIMEVLPNGLMRIEGSKIISMNAEEEIMVISGLVRQRDINSENSIDSSRIANMRIDFYGKGTLGEIQEPGWLYGFLKKIMPF
jgi:flagellar L-ring protein precursor FlgH